MAEHGEGAAAKGMFRKLGISGLVAAAGAAAGLLFTTRSNRLREAVSELPESARSLVDDLAERIGPTGDGDGWNEGAAGELPEHFEARRRERRERRERRRQKTTR